MASSRVLDRPPSEHSVTGARRSHFARWPWPLWASLFVAAIAFDALAAVAQAAPYFGVDLALEQWVQSFRTPALTLFLGAVSWVGFPPESGVEFGAIIALLFLIGQRWASFAALLDAAGAAGWWYLYVPLVHRPRPSADLVHVERAIPLGTFPSGHVVNILCFFGFVIFLALVLMAPSWRRALVVWFCVALIALTGPARIYSGEHWPSDVLGGYLLGAVWLAISIQVYRIGAHRLHQPRRRGDRVPLAD